jgi:hypothetical protein
MKVDLPNEKILCYHCNIILDGSEYNQDITKIINNFGISVPFCRITLCKTCFINKSCIDCHKISEEVDGFPDPYNCGHGEILCEQCYKIRCKIYFT